MSIPSQFDELENRLARLHELARKHRVTPEALHAQRDALAAELESLRNAGVRLQALDGEIAVATKAWRSAADALGKSRAKAATALSRATTALIAELGMGGGRFEVALEPVEGDRPGSAGRRTRRIPRLRQCRATAASAAQGGIGRRAVAHFAGHRGRRARP